MRDPNRKVVFLLWTVIAVLVIGAATGGFLLVRKMDDLTQTNSDLSDSNDSLQRQLQDAKSATPSPSPSPSASPSPTASASPSPTVKPSPSASPKL